MKDSGRTKLVDVLGRYHLSMVLKLFSLLSLLCISLLLTTCGTNSFQAAQVTLSAQPLVTQQLLPDEPMVEQHESLGEFLDIPELRPVSANNLIYHDEFQSLVKVEYRSADQANVILKTSTPVPVKVKDSHPVEVHADIDGSLTDLFITLDLLQQNIGSWYLKWAELSTVDRLGTTQYGDNVISIGSPPYQRATDALAPGWTYYRVVGINP